MSLCFIILFDLICFVLAYTCPASWVASPDGATCYYVSDTIQTKLASSLYCQIHGGNLVSAPTKTESDFISSISQVKLFLKINLFLKRHNQTKNQPKAKIVFSLLDIVIYVFLILHMHVRK